MESDPKNEIEFWLSAILKDEELEDFSVNILGYSEKGDAFMGDIVFVTVNGTKKDNIKQSYNLVLKCSKKSEVLRKTTPVKEAFLNEMHFYKTVLPSFFQFQEDKKVQNPFNNIPKFYGYFTDENTEILALENLKTLGYELWPKHLPLEREHIEMVVKEYGKLHATSVALEREKPEVFQEIKKGIIDMFLEFNKTDNVPMLKLIIHELYELLKDDLDEETLQKWGNFKDQVYPFINMMSGKLSTLQVITHGDSWTNNFMFLCKEGVPVKVAFLDWQLSRYTTPITDVSSFLMTCASENELKDLDEILLIYHNSFVTHLKEQECKDANSVYPLEEFFSDWKKYVRYGILQSVIMMKIVSKNKDEAVDMAELVESGKNYTENFVAKIKDTTTFKNRMRPIIEYAVKNNFI